MKKGSREYAIEFFKKYSERGITQPENCPVAVNKTIILRKIAKPTKINIGLILPDTSNFSRATAVISSVGHNVKYIKPGMEVIVNPKINQYIISEKDGLDYYMCSERDIYAVFDDNGFPVIPFDRAATILSRSSGEVTNSGIYVGSEMQNQSNVHRIYSAGPDFDFAKHQDKIIANHYANNIILIGTETLGLLDNVDVFAILNDKDIAGTERLPVEERKQYSWEELPTIEPSKEEVQEEEDDLREALELLKRESPKAPKWRTNNRPRNKKK